MTRFAAVIALVSLLVASAVVPTEGIGVLPQSTQQKPPPPRTQKPAPPKPAAPTAKPEPPPPATDVRVTTAYTQGPQVSENTTYIKGDRQRVEFPGVVTINQCDLQRTVMLNTSAKKFRVQPHPPAAAPPPPAPAPAVDPMTGMPAAPAKGGVIFASTTFIDTLERQQMFGLEARRIRTVVERRPDDNKTCDKSVLKIETDAWYVDLPSQSACVVPTAAPPPPAAPDPDACTDRVTTRVSGSAKLGFPVKSTTTTTTGEGDKAETTSVSQEVTALEITRLDKALFDVPADYTEAASTAEIVPAVAKGGTISDALFGSTADGTSKVIAKRSGTVRIGVLEPSNRTDQRLPASMLRQDLATRFSKAPYEAIAIAGATADEARADATRLECDYVLVTEITEAKTSKPSRLGGALRRVSGEGAKDVHDAKVQYSLYDVRTGQRTKIAGESKASSGGFGLGSALRLAAFAGRLYIGFMMMGGMGMNPMMSGGPGGVGSSFFDPRATAMNSIAAGLDSGVAYGDSAETELRETVAEALANASKSVAEGLRRAARNSYFLLFSL